jgi:tRNA threonylcarbamoyladenosine biosynthesis protein TsaE
MSLLRNGRFDEHSMENLAYRLAEVVETPLVIHLHGDLGAGKTTLARALIHGLGYTGRVKSPTYGLLEHYEAGACYVLHLDLYRIAEPGELEFLGIPDLLDSRTLLLVEWPERGGRYLPSPDLTVHFRHAGEERLLRWQAHTERGEKVCQDLDELIQ